VAQVFVWHEPTHVTGITRYGRKAGWIVDYIQLSPSEALASYKGDGLICQLHPSWESLIEVVRRCPLPKVELGGYVPDLKIPLVSPDYYAGGRLAAEHFLERGFRHFAFLSSRHQGRPRNSLIDGFRERVLVGGGALDVLTWEGSTPESSDSSDPTDEGPKDELEMRLCSLPKPLALLAEDPFLGVAVVDRCEEAGILVPEEVAIVALGISEPLWDLAPIPLSCVVADHEAQGYEAAALLDRLMNGAEPPAAPILTPFKEVEVRESSDVIAVSHPQAARALLHIMRNLDHADLSVSDVVDATTMSRAALYREFEKHIGRSIAAEIDRRRMEKAADMLTATKAKVVRVAQACGYANPKRFYESFKRATGMTPTEYRLQRETGFKIHKTARFISSGA
jgi:LacI family transcriptional regulator